MNLNYALSFLAFSVYENFQMKAREFESPVVGIESNGTCQNIAFVSSRIHKIFAQFKIFFRSFGKLLRY